MQHNCRNIYIYGYININTDEDIWSMAVALGETASLPRELSASLDH